MTDSVGYQFWKVWERKEAAKKALAVGTVFYYNEGEEYMADKKLQWHPAFQAALQIELENWSGI